MAKENPGIKPRNFFLNEIHELAPVGKSGGGKLPQYVPISWSAKATQISGSLQATKSDIAKSIDPLKDSRYFVLSEPVLEVEKISSDKKKAPTGTFKEKTDYGSKKHGKVFDKLGLELLHVTTDGKAVVHALKDKYDQLLERSKSLDNLGPREQSRWVTIESFTTVPLELRVDTVWLQQLKPNELSDFIIELQPVLTRLESDKVLRAVSDILSKNKTGEKLVGVGTDFSGRYWFRGKANRNSIRTIAKEFFSVQSIHSPQFSIAAARSGRGNSTSPAPQASTIQVDPDLLPCVAVVDLGIPREHTRLRDYRRGEYYPPEAARSSVGKHGSFVASRIVFGDCEDQESLANAHGLCSYYDAMVGMHPYLTRNDHIDDKLVMDALRNVRGSAPDVRVFNFSFADRRALSEYSEVDQNERRLLVQDLDNFIFANDAVVIIASGNSKFGQAPSAAYPNHYTDPKWAFGSWATSYNSLVCGSFVSRLSTEGLAQVGCPSPFTRIGPETHKTLLPSFSAEGGNTDGSYEFRQGLGVWGFNEQGQAEDSIGTSYAAPILSRICAVTLRELQHYCASGTQPFAVTLRALMTLYARREQFEDEPMSLLAERTLGYGKPDPQLLSNPVPGKAVILWQGYVDSPNDTVRIQLPIPKEWLRQAVHPRLRIVVCYDPPVNLAATQTWSCRKVKPILKTTPDSNGIQAPRGGHDSYPLIDRTYKLDNYRPGQTRAAPLDMWTLEISYDEVFAYTPNSDFDPKQRVAFAAELFDESAVPIDPQPALQALPITQSMNRLAIQRESIRNPIIIRSRV